MKAIANLENWHYFAYSILFALAAVCTGVVSGVVIVPEGLKDVAPYAGLVGIFLAAFLPRIQTQTGPGAPPILSPPPKDVLPRG